MQCELPSLLLKELTNTWACSDGNAGVLPRSGLVWLAWDGPGICQCCIVACLGGIMYRVWRIWAH